MDWPEYTYYYMFSNASQQISFQETEKTLSLKAYLCHYLPYRVVWEKKTES